MTDDDDTTLNTETTPDPRRPIREMSTFNPPAQRFALGDELGRGGMGQVIAARDVSLRRGVAIKKVLSTNEVDLERFDREVRITAELEHPSIVPIHDVGIDDEGRPFYVMRQIRGEPLGSRISVAATLRARLALVPSLLSVTDAAAFAHARRILHRDIKPANILLGAFGETLLIDWGLARREGEVEPKIPEAADSLPGGALTVAGYVYGTPGYMAPEQARGEVVDARADVFALGATLFHILVGRGPYDGMTAGDRMQAAVEDRPAPFDLLPLDAPAELRAITIKAMAVDPAERYPDAGALAADLRAFLEGQLVGAHRYSFGEHARRFARRHRAALAIALLAIIALAVVGVIAIQSVIDERSDARLADGEAKRERERAVDQAQQVLLSDASLLAESDPARAVAKLRHLDPTSPYGRRARDIAVKASARGVAHGDIEHRARISALQLGPDHTLASGDDHGRVVLRTLRPKILRRAELGGPVDRLEWLDGHTVVASTLTGRLMELGIVPTADRDLAPGRVAGMFVVVDNKILVVDTTLHQLFEIDRSSRITRMVARDVDVVARGNNAIVIAGSAGVRWLRGDREIKMSPSALVTRFGVAVSRDGLRAAAAIGDRVIEWDDAGRELRSWNVALPFQLAYAGSRLYALTVSSSLVSLGPAVTHTAIKRGQIIAITSTNTGLVVTFKDGSVSLVDGDVPRDLPFAFARVSRATGEPASSLLVMGSEVGEVRWWDLSALLPRRIFGNDLIPCMIDARSAYFLTSEGKLVVLDRTTLAQRVIGDVTQPMVMQCKGMLRDQLLVMQNFEGGWVIDVRTGRSRHVSDGWIEMDPDTDTVLVPRDNQVIELAHGVGEPRVLWTTKTHVVTVQPNGRWVAARARDGELVRIDRETGRVDPVTSWPGPFHVGPTGEVWYATDRWLWRWTDRGPSLLVSAPRAIQTIHSDGQPLLVQLVDGTLWSVAADGTTKQIATTTRLLTAGARKFVVFAPTQDRITQYGMKSGERIQRMVMAEAHGAILTPDEQSMLIRSGPGSSLIYFDAVPDDLAKMKSWLDDATNARLDLKTDVLSWPVD